MTPKFSPTVSSEDWEATPAAVKALVLSLADRVEELQVQGLEQQEMVATLSARVKQLEDRLVKDSHNSSYPPSSDSFHKTKHTRSVRMKSGKKPGGQPGHTGQTLRMVDKPDIEIPLIAKQCDHCGCSLEDAETIGIERRQVLDLPPIRLQATEYQAHKKRCRHCRQTTKLPFPEGIVQPVQYGKEVAAMALYLRNQQLLPYERTCQVMSDLCGCHLSEATLGAITNECSEALVETEEQIKQALVNADVIGADETGMYVAGKREWLHTVCTPTLTHYARHAKRGKDATDAIGILPLFRGKGTHDAWAPYFKYDGWIHTLCNGHHLRELTFVHEQEKQLWAKEMVELLLDIKRAVDEAKVRGEANLGEEVLLGFRVQYEQTILQAHDTNPTLSARAEGVRRGRPRQTKSRNLLLRLEKHADAVLAFMYDFRVPFDNNQSERDLRMMKLQQKISGCFRSPTHADMFCRIRSYISTMRKQGRNVLSALRAALHHSPFQPIPDG